MSLQPNGPAPYTTTIAATTIMDAYRDRGLGVPITTDVIVRAGVPESLAGRTRQSLVQLELLDESGRPTQQFEDLRLVRGDEEYRQRLQEWLRGVYADVLQYCDPSVDSGAKVAEAFRTYEPAGQRRAMGLLLVGLWKYSGLAVPEPTATAGDRKPQVKRTQPSPSRAPRRVTEQRESAASVATDGLPQGLLGLLHQIPRNGDGWSEARRSAFLTAFTAVLDFSVPIATVNGFTDAAEEEAY